MSKTKIKRKTTGFDILYRVVTAIMAVAMFPIAYFAKLVFIVVSHEELSNALNTLLDGDDPGGTYFEWGISDVFSSSSSLSWFIDEESMGEFQFSMIWNNEYFRAAFIALVFFAIALVIALVILGFAIFSNKIKVIAGLSAGGIVAMIASLISFTSFFANPITSGEVGLAELLNVEESLISLALGFVEITTIKLEGAFFWVLFLMAAILIWSVSVHIVNVSDEKEKAQKAMAKARNK